MSGKTLGIIGGMGPMASELFYRMLTEKTIAARDQEHINILLLSDTSVPDRTEAIFSGSAEEIAKVEDQLRNDALFLERSGCDAICVSCNTAHYFIDRFESEIGIPFLHLIRLSAARMAELYPGGKIAVLATDGTVRTELYQKELAALGLEYYLPRESTQALLMRVIYGQVKAGINPDIEDFRLMENELHAAGCDGALLACTELSVAKRELGLGDFFTDSMEVMAEEALDFMGAARK